MPTMLELQCATILNAAASADLGIVVKTNDPYKARYSLYNTRKLLGDFTHKELQIRVSPNDADGEIWIIKRTEAPGFVPQLLDT
jgi:hypothetical protein